MIPLGHLSVLSLAATTWRLWLPRGGETSRCPPYPKADPSSSSFIPGFRDEAVRKRTSRAYECFAKRIKFSNKSKNLWTLQRQIPESESCQIAPRPHSHRRVRSAASAPPAPRHQATPVTRCFWPRRGHPLRQLAARGAANTISPESLNTRAWYTCATT